MLHRKAEEKLADWKAHRSKQGLLLTGARQVGKTTLVRDFAARNYDSFVELNFVDNPNAASTLSAAANTKDLLLRISVLTGEEVTPGKTLLFLDEIQECQDMLTWVKFLAGDYGIDVVLSGSLLGIDAFVDVRSFPVGYLSVVEMFPLTFEEYCAACGPGADAWALLEESLRSRKPVPGYLHEALTRRFREYLLVGGMPDAVQAFVDSSQVPPVRRVQNGIVDMYEADIVKYVSDLTEARQTKMVYEAIPSQLATPAKRFRYTRMGKNLRFSNLETAFDWLVGAGIAIEVTRVGEPVFPLGLSEDRASFKFFMNDIGLMASRVMGDVSLEILDGAGTVNYGSVYEAFVAQELRAAGFAPHYYSSKKRGEVDFAIEDKATGRVRLVEVKSGKDYKRHSALSKLIESGEAKDPVVLCNENYAEASGRRYVPVYAASLLGKL
jgi:uncharacterized protein